MNYIVIGANKMLFAWVIRVLLPINNPYVYNQGKPR